MQPTPLSASLDLAGTPADAPAGDGASASAGQPHSTGILPCQDLRAMVVRKEISGLEPIADDQFQPASIDLRLGPKAYRIRASFLPGTQTVRQKLDAFAMHEMDITKGAVLERGCVYIIPLLEMLDLRHRTSATGNPKSSDRPGSTCSPGSSPTTASPSTRCPSSTAASSSRRSRRARSACSCAPARA